MDRNDTVPFLLGSFLTAFAALVIVMAVIAGDELADALESACGACE